MSKGNHQSQFTTLTSASDLSAKQYLFAKLSGDDGCDQAGAGEDAVGTVYDGGTASGARCSIMIGPIVLIELNATLSAGAEVMSDSGGKAVAWVTANRSLGYLKEGGAAGDVVPMFFALNGRKA